MTDQHALLFDDTQVRRARMRGWHSGQAGAFLREEVAARLKDRLADIKRTFTHITDVGAQAGFAGAACVSEVCPPWLDPTKHQAHTSPYDLGLKESASDLVVSNLTLHSHNDPVGTLIQIRRHLKPDGLFMGALFGGETLHELRHSLLAAEAEITGGAHMRVAPFGDVRDLGGLLGRAGFALPVADQDRITVTYAHPLALLADLRAMGETNSLAQRPRTSLRKHVLMRMAEIYLEKFADARGRAVATFDIVFLTGWAPHESQQKPLKPGTASVNLNDIFQAKRTPK